jgi:hypothetical protein
MSVGALRSAETGRPEITIPEGAAGRRLRLVLLICSSSLFITYLDSYVSHLNNRDVSDLGRRRLSAGSTVFGRPRGSTSANARLTWQPKTRGCR